MMAGEAGDELALMICPNSDCHTLNQVTDGKCLHCGLPLTWMQQSSLFRAALTASIVLRRSEIWQVELHVRAEWPDSGAQVNLVSKSGDSLTWPLPSGQQLLLTVQSGFDSATVTCGDHSTTLTLPCRDHELPEGLRLSARYVVVPRLSNPTCPQPNGTPLKDTDSKHAEVRIGRLLDAGNDIEPCDSAVGLHHAVIVTQSSDNQDYLCRWIADCGSATGTFVNRHRVLSKKLESGDFVQIGPFAWVFSVEEGRLLPEQPIKGVAVRLTDAVAETGQLEPLNGTIHAGEFVAVTGKKGSGKSTLMRILSGMPGARKSGQLLIGEEGVWWSVDEHGSRFCALLGFVSQKAILHENLKPIQVVAYSARLRGVGCDEDKITTLLHKFELSDADCQKAFRDISGGEKQLVRTVAELVARPALLLLDEPDSGLDAETRRKLLKHLRRLSYLGCTVIVITHGSAELSELKVDGFDRVIRIEKTKIGHVEKGKVTLDQNPDPIVQALRTVPSLDCFTQTAEHRPVPPPDQQEQPAHQIGAAAQWWQLIQREFDLACAVRLPIRAKLAKWLPGKLKTCVESAVVAPWLRWFELPVRPLAATVVALVFALSLAIAVPKDNDHLLGFLSVISVLWMSSSVSLLEIVGERAVFDHERHLFLKLRSYVGAKFTSNLILALIQALVFFVALDVLRNCIHKGSSIAAASREVLPSLGCWRLVVLMGIAAIGSALGLTISAIANRQKELASFILPLVMIGQIVFSVPITQDHVSQDSLLKAYGKFNLQRCPCGNLVETWDPLKFKRAVPAIPTAEKLLPYRFRLGLCHRCFDLADDAAREDMPQQLSSHDEVFALIQQRLTNGHGSRSTSSANLWPTRIPAALSYLTVSRHGDIILRGLNEAELQAEDQVSVSHWSRESLIFLMIHFVGMVLITIFVLWCQSRFASNQ